MSYDRRSQAAKLGWLKRRAACAPHGKKVSRMLVLRAAVHDDLLAALGKQKGRA
jgi:hypothetical protein